MPPPQWSWTTLRPRSAPAARGDEVDLLLDEVEVGASATWWVPVMTTVQPQKKQSFSQKGRWK